MLRKKAVGQEGRLISLVLVRFFIFRSSHWHPSKSSLRYAFSLVSCLFSCYFYVFINFCRALRARRTSLLGGGGIVMMHDYSKGSALISQLHHNTATYSYSLV